MTAIKLCDGHIYQKTTKDTKRPYISVDLTEAVSKLNEHRLWYEYLLLDPEAKLYFDYDGKCEERDDALIVQTKTDCLNNLTRGLDLKEEDIVVASRHRYIVEKTAHFKISFRFFVPKYRTQVHKMRELVERLDFKWDKTVYKASEQLLGCVNNYKTKKVEHELLRMESGHAIEDSIVQHVEGTEYFQFRDPPTSLNMPPQDDDNVSVLSSMSQASGVTGKVEFEMLRDVVMGLKPERAGERQDWIEVLWAINNVSRDNGYVKKGRDLIHAFSKQCPSKYDEDAVESEIDRCRAKAKKEKNIKHLLRILREDNPQLHATMTTGLAVRDEEDDEKETAFSKLRRVLCDIGKANRYQKSNGYIYKPIEDCPCGYERYVDFKEYLNINLKNHPLYTNCVRRFDELKKYLENYDEDALPFMKKDTDILSFENGILKMSTREFVSYASPDIERYKGKVARHHMNIEYTTTEECPLFYQVLEHQFKTPEVCDMMFFFIGRLFFKLRTYEKLEVMPMLYGASGTGKSTVLDVVLAYFDPASVGSITGNLEKVFGLETKYNKELIVAPDLPPNMSSILEESLFLNMVTGDTVIVPQKGKAALDFKWQAPMIWCGNKLADYPDTRGNVNRRVPVFYFNENVKTKDTTLESKIHGAELCGILNRSLRTYFDLIERHEGKEFWSWCPSYFNETRQLQKETHDYLYKFLTAGPDDNKSRTTKYYVRYIEGKTVMLADFKKAFDCFLKYNHPGVKYVWTGDYSVFWHLGYGVQTNNICKSCGKEARKGCCQHYHTSNRVKRVVISGMELVQERIEPAYAFDDDYD